MFGVEVSGTKHIEVPWLTASMPAVQWRYAFDSLDAAVCIVDTRLRVTAANRAWDALVYSLGQPALLAAELLGRPLLGSLSAADRDRWDSIGMRLLDGEEASYWTEFEWPSALGRAWIRLTARSLLNEAGEAVGVSFMLNDITEERLNADEVLKRRVELRGLFEVAQSVGMISDPAELYRRVTGHLAYLFGVRLCAIAVRDDESSAIRVRAPAHGLKDDEVSEFDVPAEILAKAEGANAAPGQAAFLLLDDLSKPDSSCQALAARWDFESLLIAPLRNQGRLLGYLILADGAGYFTHGAGNLLATFAGLIAPAIDASALVLRLQDRADRLTTALAELQELDRLRDQLVQNVSHELRLPLMVIQGYADLLRMGALGTLDATPQQAVEVISDKAAVLGKRVEDIVLLRDIQHADLNLEPVLLGELVRAVVERLRSQAQAGGVVLCEDIVPDLKPIRVDRKRIEQVVSELLDNAIKFSPDGGELRIAVREGGDVVYLKVSDQGIGIAPGHIDRVWDRFYQSDGSTTRRFGGTGVGLAVVKQIVDAHGGQVWAESEAGRGSRFYVALRRTDH